jgi:hypothetical protein
MLKVRVSPQGSAYFSGELREAGYIGDLSAIPDACVLVIPKPGSEDRDVAESLQYMAKHFEISARVKEREVKDPHISQLELNKDGRVSVEEEYEPKKFAKKRGKQYVVYDPETKRFHLEPIK